MNEKVKELLTPQLLKWGGDSGDNFSEELEKFAELIIKECTRICTQENPDPRDSVELQCANRILNHFDVLNYRFPAIDGSKVNNIFDVKSEWPMDDSSLKKYLSVKYANTAISDLSYFVSEDNQKITTEDSLVFVSEDSVLLSGFQWAYNNTHSYYKIETTKFVGTNESYSDTTQITEEEYNSISTGITNITLSDGKVIEVSLEKTFKTYYDYEKELNEKKRSIRILKPEFGYTVQTELESFMNG